MGAFDIAVLILEIAKKNVQDLDPEVASVQHGCELKQKYNARWGEHWVGLGVFSPCGYEQPFGGLVNLHP